MLSKGYSVTVIALGGKNVPSCSDPEGVEVIRLRIWTRVIFRSSVFLPLKYLEAVIRMFLAGLVRRAAVYHCHDVETLPVGILLAKFTRAKLVYDSHELHIERSGQSWFVRKMIYIAESICLRAVDLVIMSDGESRIQHFKRVYRIVDNPPIIDIGNYSPIPKEIPRSTLTERLNLPPGRIIVIYVGNIGYGRGVNKILPLLREFPQIVYVLMGRTSPEVKTHMQAIADTLGVGDRLVFLPPVPPEKVVETIYGAHIGLCLIENVSLSYFYSRPTKLFEYMAAGVPVIGSRFPEITEVLIGGDGGSAGWLVDPDSPDELRSVVQEIVSNPDLIRRYGRNARERVLNRYNWEREAERLCRAYAELAT